MRLVALDEAAGLDQLQAARIKSCLLELVPAAGCHVRQEPVVQVVVTGHFTDVLHSPLLHRVEQIAGFRFRVEYGAD